MKERAFTPLHPESPALKSGEEGQIKIKSSRKPRPKGRGVTGFTLVEIMIVVAIVMVLATMLGAAILRSRLTAYEGAAVGNLRAINNGCQLYHINNETYPEGLANLIAPDSNPPYLDATLASGRKQGYEFVYVLVTADHFTVNANPTHTGLLKGRYFYMDESGVVRAKSNSPAGPDDEIVK